MKAPDALRGKLRAEMARRPSPTRAAVRRRGGIVLAVAALVVLGFGASKGNPWHMGRPDAYVTSAWVALALLAALATVSWWRHPAALREGGVARRSRVAGGLAVAVAATFASTSLLFVTDGPEASAAADLGCGVSFGVVGLGLLGLFVWERRGTVPVGAAAAGAVLAAAVAGWLAMAVHARCRYADLEHVLAAHALPVLLLVAGGALVGLQWLAPRAEGMGRGSAG